MKIGFIGLGKLGLPCAEVVAGKGHTVYGYDIQEVVSNTVNVVKTIEDCVKEQNIVFVAVPTPHDQDYDGRFPTAHLEPKDFSYEIVEDVLKEANKYMNKEQLEKLIAATEAKMKKAAKEMDFMSAAQFRDEAFALKKKVEKMS